MLEGRAQTASQVNKAIRGAERDEIDGSDVAIGVPVEKREKPNLERRLPLDIVGARCHCGDFRTG